MSQYYYLIASLPYLVYDEAPPLSVETFYTLCQEQLNPADFRLLRLSQLTGLDLSDADPTKMHNPVLEQWQMWEINLRNELVKLRAQKQNKAAEKYLRPTPYLFGTEAVALEAISQSSPLAAEETLDQARWRFLNYLETGQFFNMEKLVVYALKLQLLEKRATRNVNKGKDYFNYMSDKKLAEIKAGVQR